MGLLKILIADSQSVVRFGIRHVVESSFDLKIVGEATTIQEVVEQVELLSPDLVIGDPFSMSGRPDLSRLSSKVKVLVISDRYNKNEVDYMIAQGVESYLTKSCSKEEILQAIYSISNNERFFCNTVLNVILQQDDRKGNGDFTDLTPREIEIVQLVAEGLSSGEIAAKLSLSTHTVNTHRKNIMRKLKVNNSSELVVQAANAGILSQI